jgi:AraC-like DNA-binding protein
LLNPDQKSSLNFDLVYNVVYDAAMGDFDTYMTNIDITNTEYRLRIGTAMHQSLGSEWSWDHTRHSWYKEPAMLLWLIRSGAADLWADGDHYLADRGSFFLMPASGHTYCGRYISGKPFEVTWMFFCFIDKHGKSINFENIDGIPFGSRLSNLDFSMRITDRILTTAGHVQQSWLLSLLDDVKHQVELQKMSKIDIHIRQVADAVQENPARFTCLDDMRDTFSLSKDHLIRVFKNQLGVTPGEYLIRTRIDHAKGLLLMGSESIKEIAYRLGYSDQFVFSRQFKLRTGMSPKEFRRKS